MDQTWRRSALEIVNDGKHEPVFPDIRFRIAHRLKRVRSDIVPKAKLVGEIEVYAILN